MVRDIALVALGFDRGFEGAHFKIDQTVEARNFPATSRINRGAAKGEQVLAVRIGLRLIAVAKVGRPFGQRRIGGNPGFIAQLLGPGDQRQTAFLAFPVVRANVLIAIVAASH